MDFSLFKNPTRKLFLNGIVGENMTQSFQRLKETTLGYIELKYAINTELGNENLSHQEVFDH